ncbi:hypothetical protein VTJ83DRAFT_2804 [Remersonia thermophila]|uniref:Uncharacterized protein n=1 Tax=Remersonia thermophila TaxID=72144 RepID=A0ABR4DJR4_9PEZI
MAAPGNRLFHVALAVLPAAVFFIEAVVPAKAQLIQCYKFDGTVAHNSTICPGSNACCGPTATCLSNRLCTADSDPFSKAKPVRGPCAIKGWDESCAQICMYEELDKYPRVKTCADGSLCCDDDPNCCNRGQGVFLDTNGQRVSTRVTGELTRYPPTAGGRSRYTILPSGASPSPSPSTDDNGQTHTTTSVSRPTTTHDGDATSGESVLTATTPSDRDGASTSSGAAAAKPTRDPDADSSSDPATDRDSESKTDGATDSSSRSASSQSADSPESSSGSDRSLPLKLGLGLGIPLGLLVLSAILFIVFRLGRQAGRGQLAELASAFPPSSTAPSEYQSTTTITNDSPAMYQPMAAVASYPSVAGQPEPQNQHMRPVEIDGHMAVEIMQHEPRPKIHYDVVELGGQTAVEIMTHPPRTQPPQYY